MPSSVMHMRLGCAMRVVLYACCVVCVLGVLECWVYGGLGLSLYQGSGHASRVAYCTCLECLDSG